MLVKLFRVPIVYVIKLEKLINASTYEKLDEANPFHDSNTISIKMVFYLNFILFTIYVISYFTNAYVSVKDILFVGFFFSIILLLLRTDHTEIAKYLTIIYLIVLDIMLG